MSRRSFSEGGNKQPSTCPVESYSYGADKGEKMKTTLTILCLTLATAAATVHAGVFEGSVESSDPSATSYFMGNVGIGTDTPASNYALEIRGNNVARFGGSGDNWTQFQFVRYSSTLHQYPYMALQKSASNTFGASTTTRNGEYLGGFLFRGVDGNSINRNAAQILAIQDADASPSALQARLEFHTGPSRRMTILGNGNIGIGTGTPSERLHILGNHKITGNQYISGNVGIGTTSPSASFALDIRGNNVATFGGSGDNWTQFQFTRFSSLLTRYAYMVFEKSASDTYGISETTRNGEYLGGFLFRGVDGSATRRNAAGILAIQDGAASSSSVPARIEFSTSGETRIVIAANGDTIFNDDATFARGVSYVAPLGDLSMGVYTNIPGI